MKKMMMMVFCACAVFCAAVAGDDEVTVKVSLAGTRVTQKLKDDCKVAGKKAAVKKYLKKLHSDIDEKVLDQAASSYAKFVEKDIEVDESEFEGGELTESYTVTIKEKELAAWLATNGDAPDANQVGDTKLEIFVMEEPPDAGQMQLGDDLGNFFFTRYNMFQRRIRDQLVKAVNEFGFDVVLLEDNENYEEFKKKDPVLVGVSYDVNDKTRGFTQTPNFLQTVQENNPDAIALYYRIDALAYDPASGKVRTSFALTFKSLSNNKTYSLGSKDASLEVSNKTKNDFIMASIGKAVEGTIKMLINGENAGAQLTGVVRKLRKEASAPKGPMKLVVNCASVDSKIRIKFRLALKNALVEKGLVKKGGVKVVKNSVSCTIAKEFETLDDLWGEVSEIITEAGVEDLTDDMAKKNGDTLTVTPGK